MSNPVYALLVGIDDYDDSIGKLTGCVNDVNRFEAYLKRRFGSQLRPLKLLNGDATYGDIIQKGFRGHLKNVNEGDTVIFFYGGHGAQSKSAGDFASVSPSGKDEGLVCFDSRVDPDVPHDLADKELAVLLHEVAKKGPHLTVVMDCCHSGSVTRAPAEFALGPARQTHELKRDRDLETYLDGHYASMLEREGRIDIPESSHILLAACDRRQKAHETDSNSGLFSTVMGMELERADGIPAYADLFQRCRVAVRQANEKQDPQLESYGDFNPYGGFLGGEGRRADSRSTVRFDSSFDGGRWIIEAGALKGVPTRVEKPIKIQVFDEQGEEQLGKGEIVRVLPNKSEVALRRTYEWSKSVTYSAEILDPPLPPLLVFLHGSEEGIDALKEAAAAQGGPEGPEPLPVAFVDAPDGTSFSLQAAEEGEKRGFVLRRDGSDLAIHGYFDTLGFDPRSCDYMCSILARASKWQRLLDLQNWDTMLEKDDLEFWIELYPGDAGAYSSTAADDGAQEATVLFEGREGVGVGNEAEQRAHWALMAKNNGPSPVYAAPFRFSSQFGIYSYAFTDEIPANGQPVELKRSYFYMDEGANESEEVMRLFVTTDEPIDRFLLRQEDCEIGPPPRTKGAPDEDEPESDVAPNRHDWFTKTITIDLRVGSHSVQAGEDVVLQGGAVVVRKHPGVKADVRLVEAQGGTRSVGGGMHKALGSLGFDVASFAPDQGQTRGVGAKSAAVLELTGITPEDEAALGAAPLEVEVDLGLGEDEHVVPVAFDGSHFILGGEARKEAGGKATISIDSIPDSRERSLGKSLKLYFLRTLVNSKKVDRLARLDGFGDDGPTVTTDGVAEAVAKAQSVLILVHGLAGSCEAMAAGLPHIGGEGGAALHEQFDVVLTFDYENLNRPIEETAVVLKDKLAAVKLVAGHGKRVVMLSHGMGGLVARVFVEQLGGNEIVEHLVMCGPPNGGSPLGKAEAARRVLQALATLATNLTLLVPPGPIVGFLLGQLNKVTVTVGQTDPDSPLLASLAASPDPGIRYTVLTGDINRAPDEGERLGSSLLKKVGKSFALSAFHGTEEHDVLVSLGSAAKVGGEWSAAPEVREVGCHHLGYFATRTGQDALAHVAW